MPIHLPSAGRPHLARQFRRQLVLVTGLLLLTVLLRVGVNTYTMRNVSTISAKTLVIHDEESQLLASMVNQETGLRGYLVTNDPLFLQPFTQGHAQYLSTLSALASALHQQGFQDAVLALSQAQARAEVWYSTFALPTLHQIQSGDLASARSQASQLRGKALFDAYRSSIAHLQQVVGLDVTAFLTQQSQLNWGFLIAVTLLSLFALCLLWLTFTAFYHNLTAQLTSLTTIAQC
ncbi:MAG TPA: CHASE3 domain-containing protein, partial [Ktedonobacteraceae bacterium]|nr:CHASE3 domain-containing protein [Ktedonobacteraceae bacterium]